MGLPVLAWRIFVVSSRNPLVSLPRALAEGSIWGGVVGAVFTVSTWANTAFAAGPQFGGFNAAIARDWVMLTQFVVLNAALFAVIGAGVGALVWLIHRTLARHAFRF